MENFYTQYLDEVNVRYIHMDKDTKVFDILEQYGDIADVMEVFGIKRVGKYSIRRLITRGLTVQMAAKIHRVPLDEFLSMLNKACEIKE